MLRYNLVTEHNLNGGDYRALADFRYQIRRFLHFSEEAARQEDLEAQQHQMMLAIRGVESGEGPTIGVLADYMLIRHNSAVGLIDRLEKRGLVARERRSEDRRQAIVRLTPAGENVLERLADSHRAELANLAPHLISALEKALAQRPV